MVNRKPFQMVKIGNVGRRSAGDGEVNIEKQKPFPSVQPSTFKVSYFLFQKFPLSYLPRSTTRSPSAIAAPIIDQQ